MLWLAEIVARAVWWWSDTLWVEFLGAMWATGLQAVGVVGIIRIMRDWRW